MIETPYFKLQEELSRRFGAKPTEAKIIAVIKASHKAISMEEIAKQTKYSIATINNTIRKYEQHNVLIRTKKPGSKKIFVEAKKDFLKGMKESMKNVSVNCEFMIKTLPKILDSTKNKEEIEEIKKELKQAKIAHKIMNETLKKLEEY